MHSSHKLKTLIHIIITIVGNKRRYNGPHGLPGHLSVVFWASSLSWAGNSPSTSTRYETFHFQRLYLPPLPPNKHPYLKIIHSVLSLVEGMDNLACLLTSFLQVSVRLCLWRQQGTWERKPSHDCSHFEDNDWTTLSKTNQKPFAKVRYSQGYTMLCHIIISYHWQSWPHARVGAQWSERQLQRPPPQHCTRRNKIMVMGAYEKPQNVIKYRIAGNIDWTYITRFVLTNFYLTVWTMNFEP